MEYAWSEGSRKGADPNDVGRELESLRQRFGGALSPEHVVKAATSKKSVLHGLFEWDDTKAAYEHRLHQARNVIRQIVVVSNGDDTPRKAFVHVVTGEGPGYVDTVQALTDPGLREQVLAQAAKELASFERKYQGLVELADVIKVSRRVRAKLVKAGVGVQEKT